MNRRDSRWRAGKLALLAGAALLLALGAYVATHDSHSLAGESEIAVSARAAQRFIARRIVGRELAVEGAGLVGRVLTSAGAPIQGARVCAACASCAITHAEAARCTASDQTGAFALEADSTMAYVLSAQAAGFVTGYAREGAPFYVAEGKREEFELRLSEGRENIAGTVIDALGGPVAHARVKLIRVVNALTPTVEVLSDNEGRFSASVPKGNVTLRAEADGYAPTMSTYVAPTQDIILALTPESTVHGTVVELGTGKRIAGVSILAHPQGAAPRHPQTVSNEAGEFEIRGLDPGRYLFSAEGDHHRGATSRPVEVGLAERLVDLQIEVEPAALIVGRVEIAGSGAPCPEGRAVLGNEGPLTNPVDEAAQKAPQEPVVEVACPIQHDGSVRFQGVLAGVYHVMIHCTDYIYESGPALVDVRDTTSSKPLLWRVQPGGGLDVQVVSSSGKPVPNAQLSLEYPVSRGPRAMTVMVTDANGHAVTSRNLRPGTYRVRSEAIYDQEPVSVDIPQRAGMVELTLTLPGDAEVLVSVKDEAGDPVDDLRLTAKRTGPATMGTTSPGEAVPPAFRAAALDLLARRKGSLKVTAVALGDGRYRLGPLAAASYHIEALDGDNPPLIVADALALSPSQQVELTAVVSRSGTIRGKVVDEQERPVANAWVKAEYQGQTRRDNMARESQGVGLSHVLSDDEGNFQLERLAKSALYNLRVEKHHGGHVVQQGVHEGSTVSLKLPSPGTLRGSVVDENGRPATSFDVSASLINEGEPAQTQHVVSRDGHFQLEGVPAGRVQLQVSAQDGRSAEQFVDLSPTQQLGGLRLSLALPEP